MHEPVTLMHPDPRDATPRGISSGLPADLQSQSAARLRVLALVYSSVFFLAGVLPALMLPGDRAMFLSSFIQWGPAVIGITIGIGVALVIRNRWLSVPAVITLGLVFEIVSSYTIAAAEFGDPMQIQMHQGYLGLSWVAVWVVLFTVVVPTTPRRTLLSALAS